MKEDEKGLYVEVPLDDTSYNRDILASLRSGALDGMSFRMTVVAEKWDDPDETMALPVRTIREIKLYEFGPVTFPAYAATVAGVRAHAPLAYEAWRSANPPAERTVVDPSVDEDEIETPEQPKPLEVPEPEVEPDPDPEPAVATREDEAATTDTSYQPATPPPPPSHEQRKAQLEAVRHNRRIP
jgi:hypothetical protein